jgi:hypothetical protein
MRLLTNFNYSSRLITNQYTLSGKYKYILAFLSLVGMAAVLISTSRFGPGTSPDSVYYISAARSLANGQGLTAFNGMIWIIWPPLYPVLLAIPSILFGIDPLTSLPFINAILFGLMIYLSGILLSRHISNVIFMILGTGIILISNILLDLYTMAWSETLFSFLVMTFIVCLEKFLEKGNRTSFIIFTLAVALACLTRYVGVVLVPVGVVVLYFFYHKKLKIRFFSIGLFLVISVLPLSLWLLRNYSISGTLTGNRIPAVLTFTHNLALTYNSLREWTCFRPDNFIGNLLFYFLLIFLIAIIVFFTLKGYLSIMKSRLKHTGPLAISVLAYISFLILATSIYRSDPINWRLLSPVYAPGILLMLIIIDILVEPLRVRFSTLKVNNYLAVVLVIWIIFYPMRISALNMRTWLIWGTGGYSNREWKQNSELISELKKNPPESGHLIYSNEGDVLYILLNIRCQQDLIKLSKGSVEPAVTTMKPDSTYQDYDYFIYFNKFPDNYYYSIDSFEKSVNVKKIIQVKDGAIYQVGRIK